MQRQQKNDYYLGLDVGTESVGWAVSDTDYNLLKIKGKQMWGIRLFDEAKTAAERRIFRSSRRRLERKKARIRLLQMLFDEAITEVDPGFFQRMKDSFFIEEDKKKKQKNSLFNDKNYNDEDFHKKYPTIYHLRMSIIKNNNLHDVRLVYLAIHHILKNRGHFLFEGQNIDSITSFDNIYEKLVDVVDEYLEFSLECESMQRVEEIIKDNLSTKTKKKQSLKKLFGLSKEDKQIEAAFGLLCGTKEQLAVLFNDDFLKDHELNRITFDDSSYAEARESLEDLLGERIILIDTLKAIYDWSILADILDGGILNGKQYLSVAKVNDYEKHRDDLKLLKKVIKSYLPDEYHSVFRDVDGKNNYVAYTGTGKKNGKQQPINKCGKDEFYKFIDSKLSKIENSDDDVSYLLNEKAKGTLLPLQKVGRNSIIPYQVHRAELIELLKNASQYLPFLNTKDETGLSVSDKIIKIMEFRIPYYIGPLNDAHKDKGGNCWIVKNEKGKIYPWNIDKKIDKEASAENFITRMTNKCTYLKDKDVLPKNSLLYSEFEVLNEINNIKINGEKLPDTLRKLIIDELFKKYRSVTGKKLKTFLKKEGFEIEDDSLTGFDNDFKSSLKSHIDFSGNPKINIDLTVDKNRRMVEKIIFWMTVYSDGGKILKDRIISEYKDVLTEEQLNAICKLKYSGWGRLSRELLEETMGTDVQTGEHRNIIDAMRDTSENFMQLLSQKYTYAQEIEKHNIELQQEIKEISYDHLVRDLYVSPSVKRGIWQTILIVNEITSLIGKQPKKIFVEMARGPEEKERTISRKNRLLELYSNIKGEERDWKAELEKTPEDSFKSRSLYLYYTQMGKCMYTGKSIRLENIANSNIYDRDHIYPQSKTKDDSIINNLVLVERTANKEKDADIVPLKIQEKMRPMWKSLKDKGLISDEKYNRLTRKTPLTNEELAGFINRQLVETRQSTKAIATLLKGIYEESQVVYVKANAVSDFRQEELKKVKVRDINDLHHAHDAYLNIVVGNVYHTKFTSNPLRWLKSKNKQDYSLNKIFKFNLKDGEEYAWKVGGSGTIGVVRENLSNKRILYTRYATCNHGGLFDQQPVKKDKAKVPLKGDERYDVSKYGGYNTVKTAYFVLMESEKKGKIIRTIEAMPLYLDKASSENPEVFLDYCRTKYNHINPKIIIPKIKKDALLIINGFPMHLRGYTGKNISLQNAVQLWVDDTYASYIKKVFKYLGNNAKRRDKSKLLDIYESDGLSKEDNQVLYDMLLEKHNNDIYKKRPANQTKALSEQKDKFQKLTVQEQCVVLGEIFKLFSCRPVTANLQLINASRNAGNVAINKNITGNESFKLIHQSPTGLYEQTVDLLTV